MQIQEVGNALIYLASQDLKIIIGLYTLNKFGSLRVKKNIFRMNMQINRYVGKHGKASCGNLDVTPTVYCSNGLLPSTASKAKDAPNII